jgi:hypothetical protein
MVGIRSRSSTQKLVIAGALIAAACGRVDHNRGPAPGGKEESSMTAPASPELHLIIDTAGGDAIGYGYAWASKVQRVVAGTLPDDAILLHTHDADRYRGHFKCCGPERGVGLSFRRIHDMPAALQGFVARDGTIWEIVDVDP